MKKVLKNHAVSLPEIKNQQRRKFGKSCRIRICICKASQKFKN